MTRPTLRYTRGLPGSGKTTLARAWVAENPQHRVRVNRDDLRAMTHGGYVDGSTEAAVRSGQLAIIHSLLQAGYDVFNDDTNLTEQHVRALLDAVADLDVQVECVDLRDVPLATCLERNAQRTGAARLADARLLEIAYENGWPLTEVAAVAVQRLGACASGRGLDVVR